MKSFIFSSVILLLLSGTQAFWWACDEGGRVPDDVTSPHCSADRCSAVRGEYLSARVYITSDQSHAELMVRPIVFIGPGGGVGVELPTTPPHDNGCNSLFIGTTQVSCPTQPNVQYTWVVSEMIPTTLPTFQGARLQYQIWDRGFMVGCVNLIADLL